MKEMRPILMIHALPTRTTKGVNFSGRAHISLSAESAYGTKSSPQSGDFQSFHTGW
jgi:hypothetical protein